VKKKLESF